MLYIIPTPIGNLDDITIRAVKILEKCNVLICEDPRNTAQLLKLLKIPNPPKLIQYVSNHNFNYTKIHDALLEDKNSNDDGFITGLVSDAGSPGLSDPGREVVEIAIEIGLKYTVLPGSNATIPAIVASGFVSKEFIFIGFLPIKKGRNKLWGDIIRSQYPTVLYESKHRINKLIEEIYANLEPERRICICREISKMHEWIWSGTVEELKSVEVMEKGEFVVTIDKASKISNKND